MFRRWFLVLVFCAGAILGKPLALGSVGLFAKAFFYFHNGWQFSYGSIDWYEGKFILKEIVLKESAGTLHAERLSVFLSARHLEIEKPILQLSGVPRWQGGGGDWTVQMKEGKVALENLGEFSFSFERTWRSSLGRLVLEKHHSSLSIEAMQEEKEIWIDAHLHRFEADLLKPWIDLKGTADGRVHLVFIGNECKRGSTHLDFKDAGVGSSFVLGDGSLDWEGEVGKDFLANGFDTARIRLQLSKGSVLGPKGTINEIEGLFSFTAGVGAKWDFNALGLSKGAFFPVEFSGRAFLHDARPFWAESKLICQSAQFAVTGTEETEGFRWSGEVRGLDAIEGTLIQSLASLVAPNLEPFVFEQGRIDCDGEALFGKRETFKFLSSFFQSTNATNPFVHGALMLQVEDFAGHYETSSLSSKSGWIEWTSEQNGTFDFQGASGHTVTLSGKSFSIEKWEGKGAVEKGVLVHSHFEGTIEGREASLQATGTLGAFHIEAKGDNCEVSFKGIFEDRFDLDILEGRFEGLSFGGKAWIEPNGSFWLHLNRFEGSLSPLSSRYFGIDGNIRSVGEGFLAEGDLTSVNWFLQAKGELGSNIGFYCPIFQKEGDVYSFDVRIDTPKWEMLRLAGTATDGVSSFDEKRSHLLGEPIQSASCSSDLRGILSASLEVPLSWKHLISAAPIWFPEANQLISFPLDGKALLNLTYSKMGGCSMTIDGENLLWEDDPISLNMSASEKDGVWDISKLQIDECTIGVQAFRQEGMLHLKEGHASWKGGMEADFSGFVDSSFGFAFNFPSLKVRLSDVEPIASAFGIPMHGLDGVLEGKGVLSHAKKTEADFDLSSSELKTADFNWHNQGAIHLHYDSDRGISCSGLDLYCAKASFGCKIDLLEFERLRSVWMLKEAFFQLPPKFLEVFKDRPPFLTHFDFDEEICFSANLECPSDFSSLSCFVKEVSIPQGGTVQPIRNLSFSFDPTEAFVRFELDYQNYPIKVSTQVRFGDTSSGRLTLEGENLNIKAGERPLSIEWTYSKEAKFLIHEIEGQFGGIEASFHALDEGRSLIGSARVNFKELSPLIPPRISQVFTDLKMGQGYELKGKLFLDNGVSFRGLFSGKQIELFGYQLRTLLSQLEFDADRVRLFDLKISDSAGIFKIDELIAETISDRPWTLSIPHLTILELRPSLLQKPGSEPQQVGPLVVRELKIENVQGLLEDSKTYTAKGSLSFINSFRREHTVFDIPSDLLGRIVGLDLELLIPASGILEYELENGFFHLTSLYNSYSEAKRSEFFLVPEPAPKMDLDGNLYIVVSMKQYVLFKLTESFQILIDGNLGDAQFHLQKKRRFLGL